MSTLNNPNAASLVRSTSAPVAINDDNNTNGSVVGNTSPKQHETAARLLGLASVNGSGSPPHVGGGGQPQRSPRHRGNKATAPVTIPSASSSSSSSKSSRGRPDPIAIGRHRPLSTAAPPPTSPASATKRGRANSANSSSSMVPSPANGASFTFGLPNSPAASPSSGLTTPSPHYLEPASPMTIGGYVPMSPAPATNQWGGAYAPSTKTPPPTPSAPITPRSGSQVLPVLPIHLSGSLGSSPPTFSMLALQAMEPPSPAPPMYDHEPASPLQAGAAAMVAAAAKALLNYPGSTLSPPMSPSARGSSTSTNGSNGMTSSTTSAGVYASADGVALQSFSPPGHSSFLDSKVGSPGNGTTTPPAAATTTVTATSSTTVEKVMYIVRGISGSGKSTLSRTLLANATTQGLNGMVISTDDFFMTPQGYRYNPNMIQQYVSSSLLPFPFHFLLLFLVVDVVCMNRAHRTSHNKCATAVGRGVNPIIVDNTHTQAWEAKFYVTCAVANGYTVRVVEPDTPWKKDPVELAKRNTHSMPRVHWLLSSFRSLSNPPFPPSCRCLLDVPLLHIERMVARWEDDFSVATILASEAPKRGPPLTSSGRSSAKHSPASGVSPGVSPSITPAGTPAASPLQTLTGGPRTLRVPASVFVDSPSTSPQASPRGVLFGTAPSVVASKRISRSSAPAVLESSSQRAPLSNPFSALEDEDDDDNNDDDNNSDNDD
jgi:hypothetical protein